MVRNQPGKNYYVVVLLTVAELEMPYAVPRPSVVFGVIVNNVVTILGVSLTAAGTPEVLGDVYCESDAGSVATILMVMTVADPTAASNLAAISTVFDV